MDWWMVLFIILLSLLGLMFIRVPVAFAFLMVNIVAAYILWGGESGLYLLVHSIQDALTNFSLLPIPLFVLMGEIMFHSGVAPKMLNTLDKWLGRLPGRLSLLAVGGGTLLSSLTASTMATTAMLGSTLVPEMERKQYKIPMSIGPILASGGLAVMIPPSALGVLLASLGMISVGQFLIAIILPGVLMAVLFAVYIIIRAQLQPSLAPKYEVESIPLSEKLVDTAKYILPLSIIIFLVVGFIFLGIASPTESAAMGAFGSLILAAWYRQLNLKVLTNAVSGTLKLTAMILMIVAGSIAFSQILSFSGVTRNLVDLVGGLELTPVFILILMLLIIIFMGMFMESLSILMVVIPIYMPIAEVLDFNLLWFAVLVLIAIEIGQISPPFGLGLFVMKGVAPKGTTMGQIYAASVPFIFMLILLIAIVILIPPLATWLPGIMTS
ncbi:TRAP transporter large permease [Salicibibacter kimchii]|uniref:TRAP transporter large permease n=1 Tax=Salicibibacter kimchii TaxID=2099786 RepID=A0A345C177_9BACI|nr:TRAP transporter large permease subunit [Salicibibacter kimchii]AXF56958.1 TRAP transporter large permease [Salicibibacter kimchii]